MNDLPLVSIIVCCYDVNKWLKLGRLNNILNQTYANWELILVDDGSTDETPLLLDIETEKDSRIKVIHKDNGGLGSARNAGLDAATGDYIWSYDLDDEVEPGCVDYCVRVCETKQVDLLIFGYYAYTEEYGTKQKICLKEALINSNQELRDNYLERILFVPIGNGFFWNKFYRRSFIEKHKLRFSDQRIQQDEVFNLKVYEHLTKCYISPEAFYIYSIYDTGNNRSKFLPDRFDIYKSIYNQFRHLQTIWKLDDPRFEDYLMNRLFTNVEQCLTYNLFHPDCKWTTSEKKDEIARIVSDSDVLKALNYLKNKKNSFEERLYIKSFEKHNLYCIKTIHVFYGCLRKIKQIFR